MKSAVRMFQNSEQAKSWPEGYASLIERLTSCKLDQLRQDMKMDWAVIDGAIDGQMFFRIAPQPQRIPPQVLERFRQFEELMMRDFPNGQMRGGRRIRIFSRRPVREFLAFTVSEG